MAQATYAVNFGWDYTSGYLQYPQKFTTDRNWVDQALIGPPISRVVDRFVEWRWRVTVANTNYQLCGLYTQDEPVIYTATVAEHAMYMRPVSFVETYEQGADVGGAVIATTVGGVLIYRIVLRAAGAFYYFYDDTAAWVLAATSAAAANTILYPMVIPWEGSMRLDQVRVGDANPADRTADLSVDWTDNFDEGEINCRWKLVEDVDESLRVSQVYAGNAAETEVYALSVDRGSSGGILSPIADGRATVVLHDDTGVLSPESSAGGAKNTEVGRTASVVATFAGVPYDLFTGKVINIRSRALGREQKYLTTVEASDGFDWIRRQEAHIAVQRDQTTGTIMGLVLDEIGWPSADRDLDTGQTTVVYGWAGSGVPDPEEAQEVNALQVIHGLAGAEPGVVYIAGDGTFVFQDRANPMTGARLTSQFTADNTMAEIDYSRSADEVWTEAIVVAHPIEVLDSGIIWELEQATELNTHAMLVLEPLYHEDGTRRFVMASVFSFPLPGVDFTVNSASDGSGTDRVSNARAANFETGDLTQVDATTASPTVSTASAFNQTYGCEITISGTTVEEVRINPTATFEGEACLCFDPNGAVVGTTPLRILAVWGDGANPAIECELRDDGTGLQYQVRMTYRIDGGGSTSSGWYNITDDWHSVVLWVRAATLTGGPGNERRGIARFFLDGTLEYNDQDLDNDTYADNLDRVEAGMVSGGQAGNSGTVYIDDLGWLDGRQVAMDYRSRGDRATIRLHDNAAVGGWVTAIRVRGTAVAQYDPVDFTVEDNKAILNRERRTLRLDNRWIQSPDDAEDISKYLLAVLKNPHPDVTVVMQAHASDALMVQCLSREIGDRITVVEDVLGINGAYYIKRIQHQVGQGGWVHETTWWLEDVGKRAGYWVLNQSTTGVDTVLAT